VNAGTTVNPADGLAALDFARLEKRGALA